MIVAVMAGTTASDPTANMVIPQPNIIYDIEREVQKVTSGISEKFVSEPSKANALSDLIIGLKRYKNAIRWKEFFLQNNVAKESPESTVTDDSSVESPTNTSICSDTSLTSKSSLNTKLKPKNKSKNAPVGIPALEDFFKELEEILFGRLNDNYEKKSSAKEKSSTSSDIHNLLDNLRNF